MTDQPTPSKMHPDEIDIDEPLVRQLLVEQFPEWSRLPISRAPSKGTVNAIFRLGDDMAARLPRTPRYHDVETETCWLRSLPSLPLAVPVPLAIGEPNEHYPWKWAVFRWLEGDSWRPDLVTDASAEAARLAEFLQALEQLDPNTISCSPSVGIRPLADGDRAVRAYAEMASGRVDTAVFLRAWERALAIPEWTGNPVLVHSDVMAGNLLVREGRLSAVIDWASVHAGDPARDLEAAWRLFSRDDRRVFRSRMGFDDNTWERARGWVLRSIIGVTYYAETYPQFAAENLAALEEALMEIA